MVLLPAVAFWEEIAQEDAMGSGYELLSIPLPDL
jgi:hypothetical protein